MKFCPYYSGATAEGSTYTPFERGLCPKIKHTIGYQEIHRFPMLVNKYRIYDEDSRVHSAHYKSLTEKKGNNQYYGKMYNVPADKGKQKALDEKRPSGGETLASIKWFKCRVIGHPANDCNNYEKRSFNCGKTRHLIADC